MVEDAEQPKLQNRFVFVDHKFIFLLFKVWYFASKHNFQEIRNVFRREIEIKIQLSLLELCLYFLFVLILFCLRWILFVLMWSRQDQRICLGKN